MQFIPVAERYDLINHIDRWVVKNALIKLAETNLRDHDVSFSINISGKALSEVARGFGKKTIAEFVETEAVLKLLQTY